MAILVTGGAGFIGSHLIDKLIVDNKIVCIDDLNDYYDPSIKQANIHKHLHNPDFKFYQLDIADYDKLKKVFEENEITDVVNLAARAGVRPSLIDPRLYTRTNIVGTTNLLDLAKDFGVKKFTQASSSSVYGERTDGPFHEEMIINKPISPYAATKASNEQICYTYSHLYDMTITCLRFFTVYGPRQRPDLAIHKFAKLISEDKPIQMYGDGTTKRDYTYIDDIIQGVIAAMNYNQSKFEVFNLGESQTVELKYLIELLENALGKKAIIERMPLQPGDVPITYADISKSKKLLNYNPHTKIESGISKFAEWFKTKVEA